MLHYLGTHHLFFHSMAVVLKAYGASPEPKLDSAHQLAILNWTMWGRYKLMFQPRVCATCVLPFNHEQATLIPAFMQPTQKHIGRRWQ